MTQDRKSPPTPRLSRRKLLEGAGLVYAAGTVGGLSLAAGARAETAPRSKSHAGQADYDVIVVGGGFSGATAARDCRKNGLRTLLLEARGRLGGRTFDTHFNGRHVEMGGSYVHWTQPAVWTEIVRYGLEELEPAPGIASPEQMVAVVDGKRVEANAQELGEVPAAFPLYFADSARLWPRPYDTDHAWGEIVRHDKMTAAERVRKLELTPLQHAVLVATLESMAHCPLARGTSYTDNLRWWALCLNNFSTYAEALATYTLKAGTGELVRRIAADGAVEVRLSAPVQRIEQREDVVIVTPRDRRPISAKAVILTVPPKVLQHMEFHPTLAAVKLEASRRGFSPSGFKYFTEVKGRVGNVQWYAPARYRAGIVWTYQTLPNSTLLTGYAPEAGSFDPNDEDSTQRVLRQFDPGLEVIATTSYSWDDDPFSLGTYSGPVPGGYSKYFHGLAQREGRIYMGGSDIGDATWRGFIDGAIGRGMKMAHEVSLELLG